MTAFCKDCRHIYTRPLEELQEAAEKQLAAVGNPTVPYWMCANPAGTGLEDDYGRVSCEAMRLHGRPCGPEGVLFEARDA